ncbi:hypothetical protein RND78_21520, partial [Pseudomonas oryzihabitans]|nr:hypothetical protein [Pseudomonas oryzihabitans]
MSQDYKAEANNFNSEVQDKAVAVASKLASEYLNRAAMTKEQFYTSLAEQRLQSLQDIKGVAQSYSNKAALEGDAQKANLYQGMANAYADMASHYGAESAEAFNARVDAAVLKGLGNMAGTAGDLYTAAGAYEKYSKGDVDGASATLVGMLAGVAAWSAMIAIVGTGPVGIGVALIASIIAGDVFEKGFPGWRSIFDYWFGSDGIDQEVNGSFNTALNFVQRYDPLSLDLDGDGIETVSANTGIVFDFDGDGLKTGTGWVKGDDGFLVLDRNGNGTIDNGGELFGIDTIKANGKKATNGFDALSDLDNNADGIFNADDKAFGEVRVWQDKNQDGVAQASELKSLKDLNIAAIHLASKETNIDSNGNRITATGRFDFADGHSGTVNGNQSLAGNLDLAANPFYRTFTDKIALDETVKTLPNMQGSGAVRDLREAANASPQLAELLNHYAVLQTRAEQRAMLGQIVAAWADTASFDRLFDRLESTRIGNLNIDFEYSWVLAERNSVGGGSNGGGSPNNSGMARDGETVSGPTAEQLAHKALLEKISILEVFNGTRFYNFQSTDPNPDTGSDGSVKLSAGANFSNTVAPQRSMGGIASEIVITEKQLPLNSTQADFLNRAYDQLLDSIYDSLLLQTRLRPYLDAVEVALAANGLSFDYSQVGAMLEVVYRADKVKAVFDGLDLQGVIESEAFNKHIQEKLSVWVSGLSGEALQAISSELAKGRLGKLDANSLFLGGTVN